MKALNIFETITQYKKEHKVNMKLFGTEDSSVELYNYKTDIVLRNKLNTLINTRIDNVLLDLNAYLSIIKTLVSVNDNEKGLKKSNMILLVFLYNSTDLIREIKETFTRVCLKREFNLKEYENIIIQLLKMQNETSLIKKYL